MSTTEEMQKEGLLYKMKKGMAGTNYWKKNWVYADADYLYQWQSSGRPPEGEHPKYTCALSDYQIEESSLRKYAFKLTERSTQKTMVFAAEDFDSYDQWLRVLFSNAPGEESSATAGRGEEKSELGGGTRSESSEDFKQLAADRVADFFFEHDVSQEHKNPSVGEKDLRRLLGQLDAALNASSVTGMVVHDLGIQPTVSAGAHSGSTCVISYEAFRAWWTANSALLDRGDAADSDAAGLPRGADVSQWGGVQSRDKALCAGALDSPSVLGSVRHPRNAFLLRARIPKPSAYEAFAPPATGEEAAEWNERVQAARELASFAQSYGRRRRAVGGWGPADEESARSRLLWTNYRVTPPTKEAEENEAADGAGADELSEHSTARYTAEDAVHACLSLADVHGSFCRAAAEGARVLVDEYALPEAMKSARRVVGPPIERAAADDEEKEEEKEEMYELAGLLYRIVGAPATVADKTPDVARSARLAARDELLHRSAGLDQRGADALLGGAESLYTDYQTSEHWDRASGVHPRKIRHLLRPCTLLSTLVDYAGFRVQVFCPTHVVEQFSLLHGFASASSHSESARKRWAASSADGGSTAESRQDEDDEEEEEGSEPLFVNALPAYRSLLPQLATALNLRLTRRLLSVTPATLFETAGGNDVAAVRVDLLTNALQAHRGVDDRLYLLDAGRLFPLDLAREDSTDATVRALHPEFVRAYRKALPCGDAALRRANDNEDEDDNVVDVALEDAVGAAAHLYTVHIPAVARTLDSLTDLTVPTDSLTCTQYLHTNGLCCRHMGVLFSLCHTPCVRSLLLIECISRACKAILRQVLRRIARQSRADSLLAEHRGRSHHHDFVELMDAANERRQAAVVDLFNVLLVPSAGGAAASEDFWCGALSRVVLQKFGLDLQDVLRTCDGNRSALLHHPTLFLALQYHVNCRFKDASYAHVMQGNAGGVSGRAGAPSLFTADDLVQFSVPHSDLSLSMPGELGRVAEVAESFLWHGLPGEAANAFQLRLAFQRGALQMAAVGSAGAQGGGRAISPQQEALVAETLHKLALSLVMARQYGEARTVICKHYLARFTQHCAATARMLTLLTSLEHRSSSGAAFDKVRTLFDAGQCVYSYSLGVHHPALALHMCVLADLYRDSHCRAQCKAMLQLAHNVSRKAVGEAHLVSAVYQCKLAAMLMEEQGFREAAVLLSNSLAVFDKAALSAATSSSGGAPAGLESEVVDCLFAQTQCFAACEEIDLAFHSGFRCAEMCAARALAGRGELSAVHLSCLLLLCDLFVQKRELDSAFGLLQEAWAALRKQAIGHQQAGRALSRLACRILGLVISSLPMQTRSLFDSVAEEVLAVQQQQQQSPNGLLAADEEEMFGAMWERAVGVVCAATWAHRPVDYLTAVIQGIQSAEIRDKLGGAASPSGRTDRQLDKTISSVPLAFQAAVISKLVKNPEFSQRLVSF